MLNVAKHRALEVIDRFLGLPATYDSTHRRIEPSWPEKIENTATQEELSPPILIPESPLINFLSQTTLSQRLNIRNITLSERLGYRIEQQFRDAEALYRWLTPGQRIVTNFAWPAESHRIRWFRTPITAKDIINAAEVVHDPESLEGIVGEAQF